MFLYAPSRFKKNDLAFEIKRPVVLIKTTGRFDLSDLSFKFKQPVALKCTEFSCQFVLKKNYEYLLILLFKLRFFNTNKSIKKISNKRYSFYLKLNITLIMRQKEQCKNKLIRIFEDIKYK